MSSTNKTDNLQLNRWQGTDVPQREDFNRDNLIIDSAVSGHTGNADIHTSAAERGRWNTPYAVCTYLGDGASSRTIALNSGFEPTWGLVFAINNTPAIVDFNSKYESNYFALVSTSGSTVGVSISGSTLQVSQSAVPVLGAEYRSFNESGTTYCCIMFR